MECRNVKYIENEYRVGTFRRAALRWPSVNHKPGNNGRIGNIMLYPVPCNIISPYRHNETGDYFEILRIYEKWCMENLEDETWVSDPSMGLPYTFFFIHEQDALVFKLKFGLCGL
jgi:hypothetical protein